MPLVNISGIEGEVIIGGDVVGRDKIITNIRQIQQRALTAAEEAAQERLLEVQSLAQGVGAYAERLQAGATQQIESSKLYRGLLAYGLSDAGIFFGRDHAIHKLIQNLASGPLTILHSESGAGKTSLLQAGLAPRLLADGNLPVYLRPYDCNPAVALKRAFVADLHQIPGLAKAPLREYLRQISKVLGISTTLHILIDQFEEFFQLEESEQEAFVHELAECIDDASLATHVRWLVSLRREAFSHLSDFRPKIRNPFENDCQLNRLSRDEAQVIITKPAQTRGLSFEMELVNALLDDLGGNTIAPPQLQLVCLALYEKLPPNSTTLTYALYAEQDRAAGILRGYLGRVLTRDLPPQRRSLARQLLEALVTSDQHRARRSRTELADEIAPNGASLEGLDATLGQLVDSRLLRVEDIETGLVYELAHDYLVQEIRLDPDVQAFKAAQELLAQELRIYQRDKNTLLSEDRLKLIEPYASQLHLTPEAKALLTASQSKLKRAQEEEKRELERQARVQSLAAARFRRVALLLAFALVATLGLGVILVVTNQELGRANVELDRTNVELLDQVQTSRSRQLAAQASSWLADRPDLAGLLSIEAFRSKDTFEARSSLLSVLQQTSTSFSIWHSQTLPTNAIAISPNEQWLLFAGSQDLLLNSGLLTHRETEISITDTSRLAFSPMGDRVAVGDYQGNIRIISTDSGQLLAAITPAHKQTVSALLQSPSGQLISGSWDGTIAVWDGETYRRLVSLEVGNGVFDLALAPNNSLLAVSDGTDKIRFWDMTDFQQLEAIEGGFQGGSSINYTAIAYIPNSRLLVAGTAYGNLELWDTVAHKRVVTAISRHKNLITVISVSSDGRYLVSGDESGAIALWDSASLLELGVLAHHTDRITGLIFTNDDESLFSSSVDGLVIKWNLKSRLPVSLARQTELRANAMALCGDKLVLGTDNVGVYDSTTLTKSVATSYMQSEIAAIASTSDGCAIFVGDVKGKISQLDLLSTFLANKPIGQMEDRIAGLAVNASGQILAAGDIRGNVRVWQLQAQPITSSLLAKNLGTIRQVAFSPDGKLLVARLLNNGAVAWDTSTFSRISTPHLQDIGDTSSLAFRPHTQQLAIGTGNSIETWVVTNDQQTGRVSFGSEGSVSTIAYSIDGSILAAGISDGGIVLLNADTLQSMGLPLKVDESPGYSSMNLQFSSDEKQLFGLDLDNQTLSILDIDPESWQSTICAVTGRNLTEAEWQLYFPDQDYRKTCP